LDREISESRQKTSTYAKASVDKESKKTKVSIKIPSWEVPIAIGRGGLLKDKS
jgi:hypothetical protein